MPLIETQILQNYKGTYEASLYRSSFEPYELGSLLKVPDKDGNYYACTQFEKLLVNSFLRFNKLDIADMKTFMTAQYSRRHKPIITSQWRCDDDGCNYSIEMTETSPDFQALCMTNMKKRTRCHVLVHGILLASPHNERGGSAGVSSKYSV